MHGICYLLLYVCLQALIILPDEVLRRVCSNDSKYEIFTKKGPVFSTSIVAGVQGVKKTSDWIPFCHPLSIEACKVDIIFDKSNHVQVDCIVKTFGKTGVEMEALVGCTNAALCVYYMLKALSHDITISNVRLIRKSGGKSDYGSDIDDSD